MQSGITITCSNDLFHNIPTLAAAIGLKVAKWPDQSADDSPIIPLKIYGLPRDISIEAHRTPLLPAVVEIHFTLPPFLRDLGSFGQFISQLIRAGASPHSADLHLCKSCRYCLIGNISGHCPECGTPTTSQFPITN